MPDVPAAGGTMKTLIVGGGKGCRAIIKLAMGAFLKELTLDIECVVDIDPNAPGLLFAHEHGFRTSTNMLEAMAMPGIELIIELTGSNAVLREIYKLLPEGVKVIDHTIAHVFWDLANAQEERKRQLQELTELEQRFESFINSAHDWISIKDLEGRYVVVNPAIAGAFHRSPEEFVGRKAADMLPPSLAKTVRMHDREVIRTNRHHTYDEVIPIDGRDCYFQTIRFPLTDYRGRTVGVCTIARNVTSEKELRNQLVQSEKLAAVGKLAAGVAHEINNPLTGVLAYAEDLMDDLPEGNPHHEDLKVIVRETLRCRDIVRNLLDFARHDEPEFEEVDPNSIVDRSLVLVERLPQFRNITFEKSRTDDIPLMRCDPHQVQQVLLNLMLNAADAMNGKGRIVLATEYDRKRNRCIMSVEDMGPGIPENMIDRIFEPFFSTKGTSGLGLAVSWGIVERHGGTIEVDTAEPTGSIFRVVLPALSHKRKQQG